MIAFREEFPANYYPWLRLEARGVKLKWLSIYDPLETIAAALPGTRLLAISYRQLPERVPRRSARNR